MSGNLWMFSDMLDDKDIEMLKRDFITYYQSAAYLMNILDSNVKVTIEKII